MIPCRILGHRWTYWSSELLECPEHELMVVEVRTRQCRSCGMDDYVEEVLSGACDRYWEPPMV